MNDEPGSSPKRTDDVTAESRKDQANDEPRQKRGFVQKIIDNTRALLSLRRSESLREDLEDVLEQSSDNTFSAEERELLRNILSLRNTRVDDVMVPRADVEAVDITTTIGEMLSIFAKEGHSRMPVFRETLDDPLGMIHIKDVMTALTHRAEAGPKQTQSDDGEVQLSNEFSELDLTRIDLDMELGEMELLRPVLFVPPSMAAGDLMAKMQASRTQMALVIDEYGGTDGLVSLEDLVETVVGDIEDEHDDREVAQIFAEEENVWIADARARIEDVEDVLSLELEKGENGDQVDTLGGYIFNELGRVPVRGEIFRTRADLEIEIIEADPRRIRKVRVRKGLRVGKRAEPRRRARGTAASTSQLPADHANENAPEVSIVVTAESGSKAENSSK